MMAYQQLQNSTTTKRLAVLTEPPPGLKPMEVSKNEYQEMQKKAYDNKKMEKRVDRLEALMVCVKDLDVIERSMDTLSGRLGVDVNVAKAAKSAVPAHVAANNGKQVLNKKMKTATVTQPEWYKKESKSHAGRFYWVHKKTGETCWKAPANWQEPESEPESMQASTDAGYTSVSDYDSDVARSVTSRRSGNFPRAEFRADAPVFNPSSPTSSEAPVFRADAPVFQPAASIVTTRETLLSHRLFVVQRDVVSTQPGDITMRASVDITYA